MKKTIFLLTVLYLFLSSCETRRKASGLMTEFMRKPSLTKIADESPEFTWLVPSELKFQESYHILVASSPELLYENKADMWDSEKVKSNRSVEIEYSGKALKKDSTYFWKVKLWGTSGKETKYSEVQEFTMGNISGYETTQNIFEKETDYPVSVKRINDSIVFADFGKATFGKLRLNVKSSNEDSLIIHLGEKIKENGRLDRNPGGSIRYASVKIAVNPQRTEYNIALKADERNTNERAVQLPDSFGVIMPFRYVEIENYVTNLDKEDIIRTSYFHYFDVDQSYFKSNDSILNQVWGLCKYSIKATSFAGLYVDGDRERIPYEADAYINQLGHYCTDREYSMARRTNEYFIGNPTWPTEWILHTVPMFWEDYLYTGNIESIQHYYEKLKDKTLIALAREDGLISVNSPALTFEFLHKLGFEGENARLKDIVDWPPADKDTGWDLATEEGERDGYVFTDINTVVNAFHYYNLILMKEIAGFLKKQEDSIFYDKRAKKLKNSINTKLFDTERKVYVDGEGTDHASLHANMFPLAFGLVPDQYIEPVTDFIKSRGMACSVYGAQFLLDGLYKAGKSEYAFELMTATHDRSWWNMIETGSTITLEAWDMKYKPNADWNHAWGAAPANIIPRRLWGIRPAEPGFSKVIIQPQLSDLAWSEIKVPTIRGPIIASYNKEESNLIFEIEIPGNTQAEFILPKDNYNKIEVNGKKLEKGISSFILEPGFNKISLTVYQAGMNTLEQKLYP